MSKKTLFDLGILGNSSLCFIYDYSNLLNIDAHEKLSLKARIYQRMGEVFGFDGEIVFYSKYDFDSPDFMEYDENQAYLEAEYA